MHSLLPFDFTTKTRPLTVWLTSEDKLTSPLISRWSSPADDLIEFLISKNRCFNFLSYCSFINKGILQKLTLKYLRSIILLRRFIYIFRILIKYMQVQNSSKKYPKLFLRQSEQVASIQITILDQTKTLTSRDFFELTEIVNVNKSSYLKSQFFYSILCNPNQLKILCIFIYYCIKVNCSVEIAGLQLHYLTLLADLYIRTGFRIEIGKFSHLCSKITNIALRKCIHIIYYLIYGRLTTNSYVNTIINQLAPRSQHKKQRLKTIVSSNMIPKKQYNKQEGNFDSTPQTNTICDELISELRQIFQKNKKQKDETTKFREWIVQQQKQRENQQDEWDIADKNKINTSRHLLKSQKKYYMNFFPNRVFNQQKSAIFEQMLPNFRPNYRLMRKKKFDDSKIQKVLYLTFSTGINATHTQQIKQQQPKITKERSKIFTHNIINTNQNFKNASAQLDKIRSAITHKQKRRTQNLNLSRSKQPLCQSQKQYLQLIFKKSLDQQNFNRDQKQNSLKIDYQHENQVINLLRKQQKMKEGAQDESALKSRKGKDGQKTMNKSQNKSSRIGECSYQKRVFMYKNQYKKFMKLHLFHHQEEPGAKII